MYNAKLAPLLAAQAEMLMEDDEDAAEEQPGSSSNEAREPRGKVSQSWRVGPLFFIRRVGRGQGRAGGHQGYIPNELSRTYVTDFCMQRRGDGGWA